jgi:pantoate--beta-alanine ligase
MFIYRDIASLRKYLDDRSIEKKTIGFVPTMGALHQGHISLVDRMNEDCDISVVSIFVNPTQFNNSSDLSRYPRPVEDDIQLLYGNNCHVAFIPTVDEIYPADLSESDGNSTIEFDGLDERMEGKFRPGHFEGVAQVMHRLLTIVRPDLLYMGQKDFQQTAVVKHMIGHYGLPVKFVTAETIREDNGLAMSSRNRLLTASLKEKAAVIYQTLKEAKSAIGIAPIEKIQQEALDALSIPEFRPEYFEIADGNTLLSVEDATRHTFIVACCAVWAGDVRLIDNMILRGENELDQDILND